MLSSLLQDLVSLKNPAKAKILQGFFKTWKWEYWEWDVFLWITVPELKNVAKKYKDLGLQSLQEQLKSKIHEHRYIALAIIKLRYLELKDEKEKENLINFVKQNISSINNWDLVDTFIPYVFWEYYFNRDRSDLYIYQKSSSLWERRISIMTTFYFLKKWDFEDTLKICELLLWDKQDLIHKACGWMLREIWKVDEKVLVWFLDKNVKLMPRTMLRYAIEKFDTETRKYYLKK